jgi:hypothetical protein
MRSSTMRCGTDVRGGAREAPFAAQGKGEWGKAISNLRFQVLNGNADSLRRTAPRDILPLRGASG